ncbi:MAG TPA: amidohydrolase family protein [Jatrophihabitans sp.]|nr:amidohydrolase family protein [Jatrophihabitans sp.]
MLDADVPAWWRRLGLPGLVDVHTHFMPQRVMDAVWRYFDAGTEHYGLAWPVHYRVPERERLAILDRLGVRAFTALVYPHKPGMAESLSQWARDFAATTPGCASTGTFFPEPAAARYVRAALDAGTVIFKAHVQVGGYDPRDELLDPVWGQLAEAGAPVVVHCGSGPLPGPHTGPGPFGEVLARHPRLAAVIAHAGGPEYAQHLALVRRYPNVHLDTTMIGTPFMNDISPLPTDVIAQYGDVGDRVVLGTDFPNIPYAYAEQLAALENFGLGQDWLRAVCYDNGVRLLRLG